jgi:hypothetical protein
METTQKDSPLFTIGIITFVIVILVFAVLGISEYPF